MTDRPIIIGMSNPLSTDPTHALYPAPPGCSGHRLWAMLHEVSGATRREYVDGFDRRNLIAGPWDKGAARDAARRFSSAVSQETIVVVLGQEAARALGL